MNSQPIPNLVNQLLNCRYRRPTKFVEGLPGQKGRMEKEKEKERIKEGIKLQGREERKVEGRKTDENKEVGMKKL